MGHIAWDVSSVFAIFVSHHLRAFFFGSCIYEGCP
jgi:hypothetical protein